MSALTPAEILIAARRLAGTRPHLAAVAGIVHHETLWQLCRDELAAADVCIDSWDIRGRWFGVVVGATPRTGELQRGETIPWRVIAWLIQNIAIAWIRRTAAAETTADRAAASGRRNCQLMDNINAVENRQRHETL